MPRRSLALVGTSALFALSCRTPPPPPRIDPARLLEMTMTHDHMLGRPGHFAFADGDRTLLFLRAYAKDPTADLWAKDVATGEERRVLSAATLLAGKTETLSAAERAMRERKRIKTRGFTGYRVASDKTTVVLQLSGDVYLHDLKTGATARIDFGEGEAITDPRLSPDGRNVAFVRGHDLYVMRIDAPSASPEPGAVQVRGGVVRALTEDGAEGRAHGRAEFVAAEEMSRYRGYWWSPDSRKILYQTTDERHVERFTIADAARPETAAHVFPYPRPGKANAKVSLHIVDLESGGHTPVGWDAEAFPYLAKVLWPARGPLSILVQDRAQQHQVLRTVDPESGQTAPLLEERDEAWLNLAETAPRFSKDGRHLFWPTEDAVGWTLARLTLELTDGAWRITEEKTIVDAHAGFRKLSFIDEARGVLWFTGGPDPVETHLYRAPLDGGTPTRATPAGGEHGATLSHDGRKAVITRASLARMPESTLIDLPAPDAAPDLGAVLDEATPHRVEAVARAPRQRPNVERVTPERAAGFHAIVVRPRDFDPGRRYPVLLYVYGGPHHNTVSANRSRYQLHQWMADHGFVVVSLDGRGTMHRGRDFERALRGKLGDVPLEDQVAGLTALGAHYPELDLDRVGVYGWSFGGYLAARAVIERPDVFKVAVAGAPVTDWRYYDTHYTERYLGLLDEAPEAYEASALTSRAAALTRPLLLVHGVADDNVYFAHTLLLADALFTSRAKFSLLPLIGSTHQVTNPATRGALYDRVIQFLGGELW